MLNKSTKVWVNFLIGAIISLLLLGYLYGEIKNTFIKQGFSIDTIDIDPSYLSIVFLLLFVNLSFEILKWQILVGIVERVTFGRIVASYFSGIALSNLTPNRIGEYPARILFLNSHNNLKLAHVAILGIIAQYIAVFLFGSAGIIYFYIHLPSVFSMLAIVIAICIGIFFVTVFYKYEFILSKLVILKKWKYFPSWVQKIELSKKNLQEIPRSKKMTILLISMIRFTVYVSQYVMLLKCCRVDIPMVSCFLTASFFFWIISVVPSFALSEIGVRGSVGLFLFQNFSTNTIGILEATFLLWIINLAIPAMIGTIFMYRIKIIR